MGRQSRLLVIALIAAAGCGRSEIEDKDRFWDRDGSSDVMPETPCDSDEDCDDGLFCNGFEICFEGMCAPGDEPDCSDDVECTADTCDEETDSCYHLPDHEACPPGMLCDPVTGCFDPGPCEDDGDCDDGLFCTGAERCITGSCTPGTPPACDDAISCTRDSCDEDLDVCRYVPSDALCDDTLFCNGPEYCSTTAGCLHSFRDPCEDDDPCTTTSCHEESDSCSATLRDADGDRHVDFRCGGDDCNDDDPTVHPEMREQCRDLRDNDCDRLEDCDDPDCAGDPHCGCVPTEWRERTCDDGRDNDCDTRVDCDDPDCGCCIPTSWYESNCTNGIDEDCDYLTDCADPDCAWDPACTCIPDEWPEMSCGDGRDNDCDDLVDCDDPDCGCCIPTSWYESNCRNGVDEDCDYMLDCADPDCAGDPACACIPTSWYESNCRNGVDEDCDRLLDCADPDCSGDPSCPCVPDEWPEMTCDDGRDNDCDTRVDCDDPDCGCCIPTSWFESNCTNGIDEDCDTLLDCADPDCTGDPACGCVPDERTEVTCDDGRDNDCDTMTDCADSDCIGAPACGCVPDEWPETTCDDGRDNDCDGATDCMDGDCTCCVPTATTETSCNNGVDEDCDGQTDCLDVLDCWSDPACRCIPTEWPEVSCDDDRDNDCDRLVDCLDPNCATSPDCIDNDTCSDALDISAGGVFRGSTAGYANDYSGSCVGRGPDAVFTLVLTDVECVELDTFMSTWDTGLYVREGSCYGPEIGCNDDDPGHGVQSFLRFDILPPGTYYVFLDGWSSSSYGEYALNVFYCDVCVPSSRFESSCTNGIDDDCDYLLDCEDPDCGWDPACICIPDEWPESTCDDGRDNDCDDMPDCADPDCMWDPACWWWP